MNALEQEKCQGSRAVVAIPNDTTKPVRKYIHSIGRLPVVVAGFHGLQVIEV